ncbi:MAG: hypothetical protein J4400_04530 [Candidatus Aenigmarchaeota archaeon]|nr:hypothetical protein [Candidatus Aenigmarchaeota archaeon]
MVRAKIPVMAEINRKSLKHFDENGLYYTLFDERPDRVICEVHYKERGLYNGTYFMEAETSWMALRESPVKGEIRVYISRTKVHLDMPHYDNPNITEPIQIGALQDVELPPDVVAFMKLVYEHREGHIVNLGKAGIGALGLQPVE